GTRANPFRRSDRAGVSSRRDAARIRQPRQHHYAVERPVRRDDRTAAFISYQLGEHTGIQPGWDFAGIRQPRQYDYAVGCAEYTADVGTRAHRTHELGKYPQLH